MELSIDTASELASIALSREGHVSSDVAWQSKRNHTAGVAARAKTMVVHVLRPGNEALARLFGEETGDEISKFDKCAWHAGPGGAPVIAACDWFAGRVLQRIDAGTYGRCEACGEPIPQERLEAVPTARFCIRDQSAR